MVGEVKIYPVPHPCRYCGELTYSKYSMSCHKCRKSVKPGTGNNRPIVIVTPILERVIQCFKDHPEGVTVSDLRKISNNAQRLLNRLEYTGVKVYEEGHKFYLLE